MIVGLEACYANQRATTKHIIRTSYAIAVIERLEEQIVIIDIAFAIATVRDVALTEVHTGSTIVSNSNIPDGNIQIFLSVGISGI